MAESSTKCFMGLFARFNHPTHRPAAPQCDKCPHNANADSLGIVAWVFGAFRKPSTIKCTNEGEHSFQNLMYIVIESLAQHFSAQLTKQKLKPKTTPSSFLTSIYVLLETAFQTTLSLFCFLSRSLCFLLQTILQAVLSCYSKKILQLLSSLLLHINPVIYSELPFNYPMNKHLLLQPLDSQGK